MMVRVKVFKMFGGVVVEKRWLFVNPRHVTAMNCVDCSVYVVGMGWLKLGKSSFKRLRRAMR